MPVFLYEALDTTGATHKGVVDAANDQEAIKKLREQNLRPSQVKAQKIKKKKGTKQAKGGAGAAPAKKKKKNGGAITFGGVSQKELVMFTRQLSTLQDAGLPLLRSLTILEDQQKPGKLRSVLGDVAADVEGGMSLSESMAKHKKTFDKLYTKMVNAGEVGGVLDIILQRLAHFMEKAQKLKGKAKSAMIYPVAVVSLALVILLLIMKFIIPQFADIFGEMGIELPALTVWLIKASKWVTGEASPDQQIPGWALVVVSPIAFVVLYRLVRATPVGMASTDWCKLRFPIFGKLLRKIVIARFTRTLSTLINAGVPILEAITITSQTCGNWVYERALKKVHDSIREGEPFAEPLREAKVCDALVVNMIAVGEETGEMDVMLTKIADNYDEEVDNAMESLTSLIQPFMIVILGGIIGTIVLALFMPMVKMITELST